MIQKVNRPPMLTLISSTKSTENDPGSSQGSGVAYENPSQQQKKEEQPKDEPKLAVVSELNKPGMTEVVTEFYFQQKSEFHVNPGLSVRYASDASPTKGLLLNKKAE